jgi:uncharacterized membrane protein YuzA (DUF378 family)
MSGSSLDKLAMVLVVIGALNWGLVGAFKVDLVDSINGVLTHNNDDMRETLNRIVYVIVGLAALWVAYKTVSDKKIIFA